MPPNQSDVSNILCEFFEIAVHNILHIKKLYPVSIFVPKRKYGVVIHQSIHPDVNSYITNSLKAVNYHLGRNQLRSFCLVFQLGSLILEKFVFDIVNSEFGFQSDPYLFDIEKHLRDFCLKLHASNSYSRPLPEDSTFEIQINTTELSNLEFNDNPMYEIISIEVIMKRKGHLAVFENILEDNSSNNEDDDDYEVKPKIQKKIYRLSDEPMRFMCRFKECFEEFDNYFEFDRHLTGHINEEDFTEKSTHTFCRYGDCDLRFISYLHAVQHMSIHAYHDRLCNLGEIAVQRNSLPDCNLENTFTCPEDEVLYICEWTHCNLQFDTICNFLAHVKMHVTANPSRDLVNKIKCEWKGCGKKYKMLYQLTKHMPVHTKDKYIACFTCGNTFASLVRFADHRSKQIPMEKQYYKCSQCLKQFATESLLRDHVRAHINQYKCPMCDMTCPKPSNVINHIRFRHLDYRLYKCNLCEHSAISKQNLEQHLITHCAEKLLACDECDFRCRSIHTLDHHIQKQHVQRRQAYECHICKEQFGRSGSLTKHLMESHSVQRPSGHSRFRYKRDPDGICRLQTIRYETVNVIKEIIENKSKEKRITEKKKLRCRFKKNIECENGSVSMEVKVEEISESNSDDEKPLSKRKKSSSDILMTICDLDEEGNVLAEVTQTQKLLNPKKEPGLDMMEL